MSQQLNIYVDDNKVNVVDANASITVTDESKCTSVTITTPITEIVRVATPGPQGQKGDIAEIGTIDGSQLYNLSSTRHWNVGIVYEIRNTEQLTFSGDYILSGSNLYIEGGVESIEYSPNKYFKKVGKIYIGGNLLVKDSLIENNGEIYVAGEVVLIGDSNITGTGIII